MRIAYILGTYPQPSETFIAREIDGLRARGHQIEVYSLFAPAGGPAEGVRYGWVTPSERLIRKVTGSTAVRALARRWAKHFAGWGCEAVMGHFASLPSTVALEAAGDRAFFISVHARDIYVEPDRLEEKLTRAAGAFTCTRENVEYLRTLCPAAADRIHLVYHGLPDAWLQAPVPDRPRTPGEPLRLLAVGRLVPKKGYHVLLDACARLRVPFRLRILGDGPQRDALARQITHLNLSEHVTLDGWASPDAVRDAYAWADVFCCPSLRDADGDQDGLPNVLVEAMSTGCMAVGSAFAAIPEAIDDGDTGLLVPPGDPLALADALARCASPTLRAHCAPRAAATIRQRFHHATWLTTLENLLKVNTP